MELLTQGAEPSSAIPNLPIEPHVPEYSGSYYISPCLDTTKLQENVRRAAKIIARLHVDAIAFRGMSGALAASAIAVATGKPMIMVRKPGDGSHSAFRVEGDKAAKTYLIVDDFVATGETAKTIVEFIAHFAPKSKCIGVLALREIGASYFYTPEGNYLDDYETRFDYYVETRDPRSWLETTWMKPTTI